MEKLPVLGKTVRRPAYRRIAEGLRDEIIQGKFKPGAQLPSTDKLATLWRSSNCTVHAALVMLVKEGWVERLNGEGTYVSDAKNRFVCAGIYHGVDICSNEHPAFLRSLHGSLLRRLKSLEKEAQIFVDPRPLDAQQPVLPALAEAIYQRRIQCLIAPTINAINSPALAQLTIPVIFLKHPFNSHFVDFDLRDFVRGSVQRLAAQGCRSIGLLTNVPSSNEVFLDVFRSTLQQTCREEGLETREEWLCAPATHRVQLPSYGYREFCRFWQLKEKPEGFIVYPDAVVQGVIPAILEIGLRAVTDRMKFVFHRNAHIDLLCPFPVTWAISDEDRLAEVMVEALLKQFRGEKTVPIWVPHEFEYAAEGMIISED